VHGSVGCADGIGLLAASVRRLCGIGGTGGAPLALVCTHYHGKTDTRPRDIARPHGRRGRTELVENALLEGLPVRLQTMQIVRTPADDVAFLYRLADGYAAGSWGGHCAALAGVPPAVITRGPSLPGALCRDEH
jgi:DNA mismatch repair ATPase MutS